MNKEQKAAAVEEIAEGLSGAEAIFAVDYRGISVPQAAELRTKLIEAGAFDGVPEANPRDTIQSALNLSRSRAEAVRDSIIEFAKSKGVQMDRSQIQPVGVGIREPFIAKPANMDQAKQNMRVEFRVVRVPAEATKQTDFDF